MKNIVLIGMMGAGKTAIGKRLADKTGMEFLDCDQIYSQRYGEDISTTFQQSGEAVFRQREVDIIEDTARTEHSVISTGGGAVVSELSMQRLKENGIIVFLKATPEVLCQRLAGATHKLKNRPLFCDKQSVERLWKARKPLYYKYADFIINTDSMDIDSAIKEIINKFDLRLTDNCSSQNLT